MTALLLSFLQSPTVLAIGGAILAALVAFMRGRVSGAQKEREQQAAERLKAREEADKIDDAIAGRDPGENRRRLKQWSR